MKTFHAIPVVCSAMRWSRSTLYQKIGQGLFIPPVKAGPKCSAWPDDEVTAVQDAYIAGKNADEIRRLVQGLVAARTATV